MEFDLNKVWGGWKHTQTPDNLKITLRTNQTEHRMFASLSELLELYGRIIHKVEGDMTIGTGQFIELKNADFSSEDSDEWLRFRKPPIEIVVESNEMKGSLENLLTEVFEAHDQANDDKQRQEQLRLVESRLKDKGVGYDVIQLYERLNVSGT